MTLTCLTLSLPSFPFVSQAQPLPNWVAPAALNCFLNSSRDPKSLSMASFSSPSGSSAINCVTHQQAVDTRKMRKHKTMPTLMSCFSISFRKPPSLPVASFKLSLFLCRQLRHGSSKNAMVGLGLHKTQQSRDALQHHLLAQHDPPQVRLLALPHGN